MSKIETKPWGLESILEANDKYSVVFVQIRKGLAIAPHCHRFRIETLHFLEGDGEVAIAAESYEILRGFTRTIAPGIIHSISARDSDVQVLMISSTEQEVDHAT